MRPSNGVSSVPIIDRNRGRDASMKFCILQQSVNVWVISEILSKPKTKRTSNLSQQKSPEFAIFWSIRRREISSEKRIVGENELLLRRGKHERAVIYWEERRV